MFDFFGERLYDILNIALTVWNVISLNVFKLLAVSPTSFKDGGPWKIISEAEPVFTGVASSLVVLFFVWGFCARGIDVKEEMRFEEILRLLIRLVLADFLVANSVTIMKAFFKSIGALVKLIGVGSGRKISLSETQIETIKSLGLVDGLFMCLIGLILALIIIGCAFMLLYTVYFRFLKVLVIVPLGAIACATLAGSNQVSHSFLTYVRYFFAVTLEAVAMALAILVCNALISAGFSLDFGDSFLGWMTVLLYLFEMTFTCVLTVGAVKGSEQLCQKALGL